MSKAHYGGRDGSPYNPLKLRKVKLFEKKVHKVSLLSSIKE